MNRLKTVASVVLVGSAVWQVMEAVELRRRLGLIGALPDGPVTADDAVTTKADVLTAAGVVLDEPVLAAATRELEDAGLDVLDLVPADLATEPALRFLRRVNPARIASDRVYSPGGAGEAVVMRPSVSERMEPVPAGPHDPTAMLRLTTRAQRYAPGAVGIRVARGLRAAPRDALHRWREVEAQTAFGRPYVDLAPAFAAAEVVFPLALAAGTVVAPVPGALALAAWSAKPALVFGGGNGSAPGALAPAGVGAASLLRLPRVVAAGLATAMAGRREIAAEQARRGDTVSPVAPPLAERFEARRDTCPWCGSTAVADHLEMGDFYQQKPGRFHLDRCADCGHVFQNPALSLAGLAYYYDQFYDGEGEGLSYVMFAGLERNDLQRIEAIAAVTEPASWLDVGTGHGHLCARAKQRFPEARIDGLDIGESVEEARRRGAVDHAYRGRFDELAPDLPHRYEVVSMHHYLEHTRDPRAELDAAAGVVAPGGLLMIEVPDPESPWGRRLGRWYWQWSQPEHQHFVPCANLVAELEERGYEIVSVERGPATLSGEFLAAAVITVQALSRSPHLPWLPRATVGERLLRAAVVTVAMPAIIAGMIVDLVKDANPAPDTIGNAYRVVARRPRDAEPWPRSVAGTGSAAR